MTFYPEDTSFNTLVQTIRKSCRTVELFEIARTVVAKTDRFVVVVAHKPQYASEGSAPRPDAGAATAEPASGPAPKPPRPQFHLSVPDGIPFESDEAAVGHVLGNHLDKFFDTAEVEVDPPKGNYQVINKCGITGELLGPPNYHRYNQIVIQHYTAKIGSRMSIEAYRSRIETIRDPEVVNQWLAKMKKTTRYTWKQNGAPKPVEAIGEIAVSPVPDIGDTAAAPAPEVPVDGGAASVAPTAAAPVPAGPLTFDSLEEARVYLLTEARDKVVRTSENARFHGKIAETMPQGEIRRAIEGALERQRRFPLDTANALRGRLRREHFTIFKKGSKGVSYVCAVKRKFRVPGQTFADSIGALISFIETNAMVRASELAQKFLRIAMAPPAKTVETPAPATATSEGGNDAAAAPITEAPKADHGLTLEERTKIIRLQGDLIWLVREGYVTEFIDGRLFAPPPVVEARKKEIEVEEHDPENFPDAPVSPAAAEVQHAAEIPPVTEGPIAADAPPAPEAIVPQAEVAPVAAESVPAESTPPAAAAAPVEANKSEPPAAQAGN